MRIQETDEILKEARHSRNHARQNQGGLLVRAWRSLLGLFGIR